MGFFTAFDRPFDPVSDWTYVGIGIETLGDAIGRSHANLVAAVAVVLVVALLALPVLALLRVTRVAAGHRDRALRAAAVLGVLWLVLRVLGAPVASTSAAALAVHEVRAVGTGLHDREILAREIARDRFRATPGDRLLTGLRGKDVLLVFVESYGRVAVQDSSFAPRIDAVLDRGTAQLRAAGFSVAQRLPHLADLRRPQLAGALDPAGGDPGRRPAALRPARRQRPPHADARVQARRLAGGRRHAGEQAGVAGRPDLLPLRRDLRPPEPRLPRPGLRHAADARPVRPGGAAPARARQAPTGCRCSPRSTSSPAMRRGRASRRSSHGTTSAMARSSTGLPVRSPRGPRCSATPTGPAPPTAIRSSTR